MATIRDCSELVAWNILDWAKVFNTWVDLQDEGMIDAFGSLRGGYDIDRAAEVLTNRGLDTQDKVDQLWIDVATGQELLGTLESGFIVKAPTVFDFSGSEGGTDEED